MSSREIAIKKLEDYRRIYEESLKSPAANDAFWAGVAEAKITWRKKWSRVSDCDFNSARVAWFLGAELNVAENCLDRHLATRGDKKALIWIGNDLGEERSFTYRELHAEVCRVANAFESLGVKKGDRVIFYLPNIPELAMGVLACARIGAIHSVIFGGFSAQSIQNRVNDCGAKLIVTANGVYRGPKIIPLKDVVDEALQMGCPSVEKVLVVNRLKDLKITWGALDTPWEKVVHPQVSATHAAPAHGAEDPLFILYTSGSTGKPKGALHTMGGYLTYAAYTHETAFQLKEDDVYWSTADIGWITGHSYILYGPLANGATTLMFEGVPTHPDASRFWQIVDQHQVSIFYSAPTAIRILAAAGDEFVKKTSRKSLRVLGTVGEPINPEAWHWYSHVVGEDRCPIVDTWWQTETGGFLITPIAGISPLKAGSASFPLPGIEPQLLNEKGVPQNGEASGALVISRSWPGQMRGVYGDQKRFYETYFSQFKGHYFTGDGARRDADGFYWITGRIDDVIQVAGHRLGTAEIESGCNTHPSVAESAAVGIPDAVTGEALHVFVVLKAGIAGSKTLSNEIVACVRKEVGPLATPKEIHFAPGLPKTRSGKIMRRILRKLAQKQFSELGDISTLADPSVVEKLIAAASAGQ